jgi:hypothetical protein
MDSWRIIVNLINRSSSVKSAPASGIGATVIPAKRGKGIPVKIQKGQTSRILQLYGNDSYHVLEAIAYNDKYPLWICAPHSNGVRSALLLTDDGLEPVTILSEEVNFKALLTSAFMGKGQEGITNYAATLPFADHLTPGRTPFAKVGDQLYELTITPGAGRILNAACAIGTGTVDMDTGQVEMVFNSAPEEGEPIYIRYEIDVSETAYALFGMNFPCEDFVALSVKQSDLSPQQLSLGIAEVESGIYSTLTGFPKEISLKEGYLDGSGKLIFVEQALKDNDLIFAKINKDKPFDSSVWDAGTGIYTNFKGGNRGDKVTGIELTAGWQKYKSTRLYPADIYFDTTGEQAAKAAMLALRNGPVPYKRFLAPAAPGFPTAAEVLGPEITLPSNRGLSVFWNGGYIQNPFAPTGDLLSTLMGEIAAKFADALVYSYGGRAVSWGDENNVGGQLTGGRIVRMLHDADQPELKDMDKKRINPVVQQELFGVMIASRRTTDTSESDYSYTDYSAIVDYCVERIVNEVLPYQITKFNDDVHRSDVGTRTLLIIKPLTVSPNNVIRDYAIKCDEENNDDEVMARQEFVLTVGIKVTPKSEIIVLNFINAGQTMRVEELVK